MENKTPVDHITKLCDFLQTKGSILKRAGPIVRQIDEERDEGQPELTPVKESLCAPGSGGGDPLTSGVANSPGRGSRRLI